MCSVRERAMPRRGAEADPANPIAVCASEQTRVRAVTSVASTECLQRLSVDEYIARMKLQLDEWNAKVAALEEKGL